MPARTQIETTRTWKSGWRISPVGELGRWDALNLDEELLDAFERGGSTIVVDLSAVTDIDPFALTVLREAAERHHRAGGELLLAARDNSPLEYTIQLLHPDEPEQLSGLHQGLDRALARDRSERRAA
jgi:anti-anti-sigma regulatory factor